MGLYKTQAARLRSRLKDAGIDIPLALSLEAIAAAHGRPNWDSLAPLDRQAPSASDSGVLDHDHTRRAYIWKRLADADTIATLTLVATESSDKRQALARAHEAIQRAGAGDDGRPVRVVDLIAERTRSNEPGEAKLAALKGVAEWARELSDQAIRAFIVFDLHGCSAAYDLEVFSAATELVARGHDCAILGGTGPDHRQQIIVGYATRSLPDVRIYSQLTLTEGSNR